MVGGDVGIDDDELHRLGPALDSLRVPEQQARFFHDDKLLGEYPIVALEPVGVAGFFGRAIDTVRLWLK